MGATLAWLKVVDAQRFRLEGGQVAAGMENVVELEGPAPARAAAFVVHRAWSQFDGAFTERYRIADRHGRTLFESHPREVLAGFGGPASGGLTDEVADVEFEFSDDAYQLVVEIDGREIARADFAVREPADRGTVQG